MYLSTRGFSSLMIQKDVRVAFWTASTRDSLDFHCASTGFVFPDGAGSEGRG